VANIPHDGTTVTAATSQTTDTVQLSAAPAHDGVMPGLGRAFPGTRLASLVMLLGLGTALFYTGRAGLYLATDKQIAPFMLTPDSDAITNSRLSLSALTTEREAAGAHREVLEQELAVTRESLQRLAQLRRKVQSTLGVVNAVTSHNERSSLEELQKLRDQKAVIDVALVDQNNFLADVTHRVESGLAHSTDLVREQSELRRLTLLQLQRERDEVNAQNRLHELNLQSASYASATGKVTPEVLRLEEQLVRMELEVRRLEADERGKVAQLTAANAQIRRVDDLIAQMQKRPLYRAIAKKQTLAFVPYTQLRGMPAGASIYECKLWSTFFCELVGRISEVLPGEVEATDPWGAPARGQYAVMDLQEPRAVMAKTLRVRARDAGVSKNLWAWLSDDAALSDTL
jgi:hypothetical protein